MLIKISCTRTFVVSFNIYEAVLVSRPVATWAKIIYSELELMSPIRSFDFF